MVRTIVIAGVSKGIGRAAADALVDDRWPSPAAFCILQWPQPLSSSTRGILCPRRSGDCSQLGFKRQSPVQFELRAALCELILMSLKRT